MHSFEVRDGQFWYDGRPLLLQAGELHYYRTPADQWAHRLGLLREAGFNAVAAYIPWLWHQPDPEVSDLDGHTHPMRDLAGFLDLAAAMDFHIIARPGPYIMAESINEGIPPWVFARHPGALFQAHTGAAQNIASYLHPDFLARVDDWYRAVFAVLTPRQVSHGGRIILTQLDNEMGMIAWVRNILDVNPDTLARFAAWMGRSDGVDIGTLDSGSLFAFAAIAYKHLRTGNEPGLTEFVEEYRRFYRDYLREYTVHLWERASFYGMDTPPVINIHGFGNGGKTFPIGLSQLVEVMAIDGMISATDVYPIFIGEGNAHQLVLVNEMTKALHKPDQPLFSIEFQAGGNQDFGGAQTSLYDLHTRLCVSVGMRAINHYLFFDGENDPVISPTRRHDWGHPVRKDGTTRAHYARYGRLSRVLDACGDALVLARPKTVTTIGFTIDSYMTEVNTDATRPLTDVLTHQRDTILFDFIARGLLLTHRPFDAVELARAALDPARIPTLWVMLDKQCDEAVQRALAEYARAGGTLIIVGRLPVETFRHEACSVFSEGIGVRIRRTDPPFTPTRITAFAYSDVPVSFVETYEGAFAEVFARDASGAAVGWALSVGAGRVIMLGAALAANTLEDLDILHQMAGMAGCDPLFTMTDWVDARLSEGEQSAFLFVNNYQDDPVETVITRAGAALFGGNAITLPARRGAILPLEWQVRPGVLLHYLTAEVTGVSEIDGLLTITTDPPQSHAELTLHGWTVEAASALDSDGRVWLHNRDGSIRLRRT